MFRMATFRPAAAPSLVRDLIGLHVVLGDIECLLLLLTYSSDLRDELFYFSL